MKITFYKSSLCPRCYLAGRALAELLTNRESIDLELVDVLVSPSRAFRDNIRMIPAIACGEKKISGIFLKKHQIATFLEEISRG